MKRTIFASREIFWHEITNFWPSNEEKMYFCKKVVKKKELHKKVVKK